MTFIKFCGMTREEDVSLAAELGVDAVGFVLWPGSPRAAEASRLPALIRALPDTITPVGVFVRPSLDAMAYAIDSGVRVLQLHGMKDPPPAGCATWIATTLADGNGEIAPHVPDGVTILLDAHDPQWHGGTGRTIDWERAARVAARRRLLLAGGLTPANVGDAIRQVHPYGVDVASGVEERPGIKNAHAMRSFVAAVRLADQ